MQTILTYMTLLLTGIFVQAQNTIEVTMTGFDNNDGSAMIALFDSEDDFLEEFYKADVGSIDDNRSQITFSDIPDGVYAISVIHDEDDNGKLNMVMGLYPSEATGASNNAPAKFGPPKWEDAKFELQNSSTLKMEINL